MPKGTALPVHIKQEILLRFDDYRRQELSIMDACVRISADIAGQHEGEFQLPPKTVWAVLNRLRPTTDMAKMYLKHQAMKLARRIVKKANVTEAIDVLSRPGMDVLSPPQKSGDATGPAGFFLTVQADTCGAVTVGAVIGQPAPKQLDAPSFDPFAGAVGGFDEKDWGAEHSGPAARVVGQGETRETVLERARAKIRAAQKAIDQGQPGLQDADEQAQADGVTVTS